MADVAGLNQFVSLPVPATTPADGVLVDMSSFVPQKSWFVQGPFNGTYILEISHDDVLFTPLARVISTGQDSRFEVPIIGTAKSMRIRREAFAVNGALPTMGITTKAICVCA